MRSSLTGIAMGLVVLGGLSAAPGIAATPDTSGTASAFLHVELIGYLWRDAWAGRSSH